MAKKTAQITYVLVWKTTTKKFEVVRGPDPGTAMSAAGYSSGALAALDYFVDLGPLLRSKTMKACLVDVASFGAHGYFWKRETCAKLERMSLLVKVTIDDLPGWKLAPLGVFVTQELKLEN